VAPAGGPGGRGYVNILAADKLIANPRLYAMFLLWMLSELFKELPEIGDPDKPKLVFTCSPSIPGTQPVSSARLEAECARLKAELKKR
jgi:DNA helicase HerA-like ATPase